MSAELLVFPLLTLGVLLCLAGFGSFWLSRKRLSTPSEESLEALREEWRGFKRQMVGEWENEYQKLRSMAGRIDRAKRTMKEAEPSADPPELAPVDGAGVGSASSLLELNRAMLKARGIGL